MRKRKVRTLYKACAVIVILTVIAGLAAWLALWPGEYKEVGSSSANHTDLLDMLQLEKGTIELTEADLNGLVSEFLSKPVAIGNIVINSAHFNLTDDKITLAAGIKYRNTNLVPSISGKLISTGDKLTFNVSRINLGRLLLPRFLIMDWLRGYSSRDIKIYNNRVEISKEVIPLNIKSVLSENNKIVVEMMSIYEIFNIEPPGENSDDSPAGAEISNADLRENTKEEKENSSTTNDKTSGSSDTSKEERAENTSGTSKSGSTSSGKTQSNTLNNQVTDKNKQNATEAALEKVSLQLENAAGELTSVNEKNMIYKIQGVINTLSKDPDFQYKKDAQEVMSWYSALPKEEKTRVKNALMHNLDVSNILKLLGIFGI